MTDPRMNKRAIREKIEGVGIVPAMSATSMDDLLLAAEAVCRGGIPIMEVRVQNSSSASFLSALKEQIPEMIVGAGGITDFEVAQRCLDSGISFLSTDGFDPEITGFALEQDVVVIPGTLTPSEVNSAWHLRPDFVKVVPCAPVGGEAYLRALKAMFPGVPLIAAGGVSQNSAIGFILAGAAALGVGDHLIPREALRARQADRIAELAHRFVGFVTAARKEISGR